MQSKKVAIITGASKGIGYDVARGLANDGYRVVLIARTENSLSDLAKQITNSGGEVKIICADITNFEFITQELTTIIKQWGRVDVLVNNAGIYKSGTLEATLDDYQAVYDVNFKAQLMLIKIVIPVMQKQKNGYIFNIASIAGKIGFAATGAYVSSKFALVGLSESLHNEYATDGIKITSICPSWVATDMAKAANLPESLMIKPVDILQTIRWLLLLSPATFVKEIVLDICRE